MADHAHHRPYEINPVPWRSKDMHAPKLYDSIHASSCGQRGEHLLSYSVGHGQPQGLNVSVETFQGVS